MGLPLRLSSFPLPGEASLEVSIIDLNDERPVFDQPVYTIRIAENQPPGAEVGAVRVTDRDGPPYNVFTLTLQSADGDDGYNRFKIDHETGMIMTTRPLDREERVPIFEHWSSCIRAGNR